MKNREIKVKITRKQLGEIYKHVCEPWRGRITQALLTENISDDAIEVDNKLLLKAYGQARSERHFMWLDKVTGGVYCLNPEIELNKWYWVKRSLGQPQDALIYVQGLSRDCKGNFGFNHGGAWFNGYEERFNICNSLERLRPAKETEVLEALKKEALRRGLIDGDVKTNRLFIIGNSLSFLDYTLMRDGIWATLVKREYIWLKTIRKGKTVIERHPEKQLVNLLSNGWKRLTESDLGQMKNELLKIKEI